MEAIKFQPLYFERIWGGRDLEKYRNDMPEGVIGESWDVTGHPAGVSVVAEGTFKGQTLVELMKQHKEALLGTKVTSEEFPLLIKLINSKDSLSVQVHPGDAYAREKENQQGKTECWYVMEAEEGAALVMGTKPCDKETFRAAAEHGTLDQHLNTIPVKKGDFFYIPSGLIHAIGPGVIIAEIQQSSDITYRVYDYNRGREMHLDQAMDVSDFTLQPEMAISETLLCKGEYFTVEKVVVAGETADTSDPERFYIYTCVDGEGSITCDGGTLKVNLGDSVMIPATLGTYTLNGQMTVLKSYVS